MTKKQLQYRELYTHLSDLIAQGLDLDSDEEADRVHNEADRVREELELCWACMNPAERSAFMAPATISREPAGVVNRDFNPQKPSAREQLKKATPSGLVPRMGRLRSPGRGKKKAE